MRVRLHELLVLGMPPDIARDERAERDHAEPLRAGKFKRGMRKLAPDTAPFKRFRHFGVDQDELVPGSPLLDEREIAVHVGFELLSGFVVLDLQIIGMSLHSLFFL